MAMESAAVYLASMKNNEKIVPFLAPMDFIIPICFVRSRTDVNIVFIIPIAPMNSEIAAIPTKTNWTTNNIEDNCAII